MPNLDSVNFLSPSSIGSAIEVTVSNIASPTELNSRAAAQGDIILARTTEAGTGSQTLYYADTTSDAESLPYIVSSATSGVKFIACGGRYNNGSKAIGSLTASRLLRTDASKNLESNAVLTNTRVLYADSNGWPTDSANLTFSGTLLTLGTGATGGLSIAATTGTTLTVSSTSSSAISCSGGVSATLATLATGTITTSTPAITSSQTWNSGATTFIGYDYNITDTASAAASLIFNYKVGTVTKLSFGCASGLSQLNIKSAAGVTAELNLNGNNTGPTTGLTIQHDASSDTYIYQRASRSIFFGTSNSTRGSISSAGVWNFSITTDATSISTGAAYSSGGFAAAKNIINGQNQCSGVTSTATAAGTTTLTSSSTKVQIFTGTNTQTINFPAANVFGAGIAVEFIVINRSTGTVTPTRAGADTFVGGGTTDPITTLNQVYYVSDGVSVWYKLAV